MTLVGSFVAPVFIIMISVFIFEYIVEAFAVLLDFALNALDDVGLSDD
jgi:hypothetical protein